MSCECLRGKAGPPALEVAADTPPVKNSSEIDLFEAIWASSAAEVQAVCAAEPARVNSKAENGATPLQYASDRGVDVIMQALLDAKASVGINETDQSLTTALHLASLRGHQGATQLLIQYNADVAVQDQDGNTPLHRAASKGHHQIVEVLITQGADRSTINKAGQTALDIARANDREATVAKLECSAA